MTRITTTSSSIVMFNIREDDVVNGIPPGLDAEPIWVAPPSSNIWQQLSTEGRDFINDIIQNADSKEMLCDKKRYLINIFLHNPTHGINNCSKRCKLCSLYYKLKEKKPYMVPIGPRKALYIDFKRGMWKYSLKRKKR